MSNGDVIQDPGLGYNPSDFGPSGIDTSGVGVTALGGTAGAAVSGSGDIWQSIGTALTTATTAAASLYKTVSGPTTPGFVYNPATGGYYNPTTGAVLPGSTSLLTGSSGTLILLAILGVGAFLLLRR